MFVAVGVGAYSTGMFHLTQQLLPLLSRAATPDDPARVINVASYWAGDLDVSDPEFKRRRYNNHTAYRQSKQANRMLSAAFAERLQVAGVMVNACHPGDVNSQLSNDLGFGGSQSPDQGADTPIWLATSPEVAGITGKYFEHRKEVICPFGSNREASRQLFELCNGYTQSQ